MAKTRFFSSTFFASILKSGLFALLFSLFAAQAYAQEPAENGKKEGEEMNMSEMIMEHVSDNYEWHFFTKPNGEHVSMPLPILLYESGVGLTHMSSAAFEEPHTTLNATYNKDDKPMTATVPAIEHNGRKYAMIGNKIYGQDGKLILFDFSITKTVASMMLSAAILLLIFFSVASAYRGRVGKAPSGFQNFMEIFVVFVRDDVAKPNIGPKYAKFLPYLLTVFFFIWINNLLGLLPTGANATGNISVTLMLALFTFILTNINGSKDYWTHVFNTPGVPWWLKVFPIIPLIEFIGLFTKPFALMIRLFANITAGHIVIMSFIGLIFIFKTLTVSPVSIFFGMFITVLELFVAILQAYIFTFLSALFIGQAVATHHDDH